MSKEEEQPKTDDLSVRNKVMLDNNTVRSLLEHKHGKGMASAVIFCMTTGFVSYFLIIIAVVCYLGIELFV